MDIRSCPNCHTRVAIVTDGTCPSCRSIVADVEKVEPALAEVPFSDIDPGFRVQPMSATTSSNPYQPPMCDSDAHRAEGAELSNKGMLWVLFAFSGRIPRRVFWGASILMFVMFYAGMSLLITIFGENSDISGIGILTLYLAMMWISLAITVKRWHDRDKSGWWILIGWVPIIGPIWQFVETGCLRGTTGTNRFGPDPT